MDGFRIFVLLVLAIALSAAGCSSLEPIELPSENARPAANAPLWLAMEEVRADNWLLLLDKGPEALDWRLTAIDSATDMIELQTFLWDWDLVGSLVMDHLLEAADRGVTIRLLVDDSFLLAGDRESIALHQHPNIEYRIFNPFKRESNNVIWRQLMNAAEFRRLDHRMHNKAMVVDNRVAIIGGRNLADEYFGVHDVANFRDLELLVGGPVVEDVGKEFDAYWNDNWSFPIEELASDIVPAPNLNKILQARQIPDELHDESTAEARQARWLAASRQAHSGEPVLYADKPPEDDINSDSSQPVQLAAELIQVLDSAQDEILIISAYLIPTDELGAAIKRATQRGVEVSILTNSIRSNNHVSAHSAYRRHIEELMTAGVSMHELRVDARDRGVYMLAPVESKKLALHAKAIVIDHDKAFVGSTNLDPRSLRINTEMGLLVHSPSLNADLRAAVAPNFITANAWQLRFSRNGSVQWVSDQVVLNEQPAASFMQRIEDWFLLHLPIEGEM